MRLFIALVHFNELFFITLTNHCGFRKSEYQAICMFENVCITFMQYMFKANNGVLAGTILIWPVYISVIDHGLPVDIVSVCLL